MYQKKDSMKDSKMIYERIPFHLLVRIFFSIRVALYLLVLCINLFLHFFGYLHFNVAAMAFIVAFPLSLCFIYFFTPLQSSPMAAGYNIVVLYIDAVVLNLMFSVLNIEDFMNVYGAYIILVIIGSVFFLKAYRIVYCLYIIACYSTYALFHMYRLDAFEADMVYSLIFSNVIILLSGVITYIYIEFINSFRHLASLGQISVELAHEVRNPLQIIETYAERGVSEPAILTEIQHQVEKVARFIQELLSLGSEATNNPRKENVTHLVDYAVSLLNSIPGYMDHVKLKKEIIDGDLTVNVDVEQITKVLTNIMRNGIDAMNKNGDISIKVQKQGGDWAQIAICDTGIGIDETDLIKIFQPFYTTKRGTRGAGLGLAIVKKFVKTNKGRICVFSQRDRGATFILKLPLAKTECIQ